MTVFRYFGKCTSIQLYYLQILLRLLSVGLQVRGLGCQNFCNVHARWSLQQQNNVQATLANLLTRLTDKRLFVFGAGRYNCMGVPCLKYNHTWCK